MYGILKKSHPWGSHFKFNASLAKLGRSLEFRHSAKTLRVMYASHDCLLSEFH